MRFGFSDRIKGLSLLVLSLFLFFTAVWLRYRFGVIFLNASSGGYSSEFLTRDFINQLLPLIDTFRKLFPDFLTGHFISVFVLTIPAVLLAFYGINLAFPGLFKRFGEIRTDKTAVIIAGFALIAAFVLILCIQQYILFNFPYVCDEFSNCFQAELLKNGQLYAQTPDPPAFFQFANIVCKEKWFSRYTIGFPTLLAIGGAAGVQFLVNPLLSCGIIVLLFLCARELAGNRAGAAAALMALFSPSFIVLGATYFPHTSESFFSLLVCYCVFLIMNRNENRIALWLPLTAAFAVIMLLLVRPGSGLVVFTGAVLPLFFKIIFTRNRNLVYPFLIVAAGAAAGVGILLLINQAQTGDPFLFAFNKYRAEEKLGFVYGHTALKGLWNFIFLFMKDSFWVFPLTLTGTIFFLISRGKTYGVFLLPVIFYVILYFHFPTLGQVEFGARYYLASFLLLLPLAAAGMETITKKLEERRTERYSPVLFMFIAAAGILTVATVAPFMINSVRMEYWSNKMVVDKLKDPEPGNDKKYITFIRTSPNDFSFVYTNNYPDYEKQKNFRVLWLSPLENQQLIKQYPDRIPLVIDHSPSSGYRLEKYNYEAAPSSEDYYAAAVNYNVSVYNQEKAESLLYLALNEDSENVSAKFYLGFILFGKKQYQKALSMFDRIEDLHPDALYYVGKCYGELGDNKSAAAAMKSYIEKYPNREKAPAARDRLKFYSKRE